MLRDRAFAWSQEHPVVLDAVLVAVLVVVLALPTGAALGTVPLLVSLALLGPLVFRRSSPAASAGAVLLVAGLQWVASFAERDVLLLAADVAVLLALHAVAAHGSRSAARAALGVALLGAGMLGVRYVLAAGRPDLQLLLLVSSLAGALALAAWALGALQRVRLQNVAALRERAERLEREREQLAALATAAERARIAREMHDVVAHSLSVVIAQADGGRYALGPTDRAAGDVLTTIATTGRAALADMRRLLGVLRDPESAPTAPQPDVPAVAALVDGVRASGLPVSLVDVGQPRPLPPALGLAVYRTVQEGLTNVLKHAGAGTPTTVALHWGDDALDLQVDDAGGGAPAEDGGGHGLTGVRERAALWGGTVHAGPRPDGRGHRLHVRLPYP